MESNVHSRNTSRCTVQLCGGIVASIGTVALLGWISGLRLLASIRPDYIPMAPNTAIVFIALGCTLFILARWQMHITTRWFTRIVVIFDLLLGFLTLIQYLFGINLSIDHLFFSATESLGSIPIGSMSYITAVNFLLAGFSVLLLSFPVNRKRMRSIASGLALTVITIGLAVILGYLYRTPLLYGGTTVPMALTTALAFIPLGIGLITTAGTNLWPLCLVSGSSTRVRLMRTFLPVTAVIVLLSGWLNTTIFLQSKSNPALISALLAILSIIVISSIISYIAGIIGGTIDRTNTERELLEKQLRAEIAKHERTDDALRKSEVRLAEAQRVAHIGSWEWDINKNKVYWSDETYRIFGSIPQESDITYETFLNYVHPDDRELVKISIDNALQGGIPHDIYFRILLKNATVRIVHGKGVVTFNNTGRVIRMIGTVQDITESKRAEEGINLLQALTKAISEADDFQAALGMVLRKVCESTE